MATISRISTTPTPAKIRARVERRRRWSSDRSPPSEAGRASPGGTGAVRTSARVQSSTFSSRLVSKSNRAGLSSKACRRTSLARLSGSSSSWGILAPSTRIGMTRTSRVKAASISSRTKSSGLSRRRRPCSSVIVSHSSPISASSTSQDPTAAVITSTKSSPNWIESTSLKTWPLPKRSASRSYSRPDAAGMGPVIAPCLPRPNPRPTDQHHRRGERLKTFLSTSGPTTAWSRRGVGGAVAALGEEAVQLGGWQGVDHPVGAGPAAGGRGRGEAHVAEVARAVAVGAEGEHGTQPQGQADLLVAEVEALGRAVDLQGGAAAGGGLAQRLQVDVAAWAGAEQATGRVADDVDGGVLAGPHQPPGQLRAGLVEPVVDAGDEHVEAVEEVVVVVERSLPVDIQLGAVQQLDVAQAPLQRADPGALVEHGLAAGAAEQELLGVVGDRQEAVAALAGGGHHHLERGGRVGRQLRVAVEVAADVVDGDQARQRPRGGRLHLAAVLAQRRRHPVEAKAPVDRLLGLGGERLALAGLQAVLGELEAGLDRPLAHADVVGL